MLYIEHTPIDEIQVSHEGYEIGAKIIPYSGEEIISSSTGVFWKIEGGEWNFVEMDPTENDYYTALIPVQENNTQFYYYIHAEDESGRSENHPYIGASMAYSFTGFFVNEPPELISIDGPTSGKIGEEYTYCVQATDPDGDQLYYKWDWDDGPATNWLSDNCLSHIWRKGGIFTIKVKVKDEFSEETPWVTLDMDIEKSKMKINNIIQHFIQKISNYFPLIAKLIGFPL
jgi:hypothetical protein